MKNSETEEVETSTRHRVFLLIVTAGPQTALELASKLDLTPAAIRRHLDALQASGVVATRDQFRRGPRGRGRPAKVFVLTDAGRAEVPNAYDKIALQAFEILNSELGPASIDRVAESYFAPVEDGFQQTMRTDPQAAPVQALADAFAADGYVTSVGTLPGGEQLCMHSCPVADVAKSYPQLCEMETKMVSRLLNSHVQRLATIAHGDGICTTNVPRNLREGIK